MCNKIFNISLYIKTRARVDFTSGYTIYETKLNILNIINTM